MSTILCNQTNRKHFFFFFNLSRPQSDIQLLVWHPLAGKTLQYYTTVRTVQNEAAAGVSKQNQCFTLQNIPNKFSLVEH